jgi:hypothetical protein
MLARLRFCVVEVNDVFLGYLPTPFHMYQMRWKDTADDDYGRIQKESVLDRPWY